MRWIAGDQHGMTIVEIMFAVGILGVGLLALSAAIPLAAYGIQEGKQLSTATFLANQRMEQVRNAQWVCQSGAPDLDNLGVSASPTVAPVSGAITTFPDESPVAAPYTDYSRTVRITNSGAGDWCNVPASPDQRQVTVTVTYRPMTGIGMSPAGTAKATVVTMYISKR